MVPSLSIQAAHTPCWFPSNFLANAQQTGLRGRKEGSSLPLCCYLLFWPLPGTVTMPGLYSAYLVALFLENATEREGNLRDASQLSPSATRALRPSSWGEPGEPSPTPLRCAPWVVPCRAGREGGSCQLRSYSWVERRLWCLSALKPTPLLRPQGKWGCSEPGKLMLVSRRCYYEVKPFPLCIYAAVPHSTSVLLISLELAQHEYR